MCGGASGEEYLYLVLNLMFQETRHSSQRCVRVHEREGGGWREEREGERESERWEVSTATNMPYKCHGMRNINIIVSENPRVADS